MLVRIATPDDVPAVLELWGRARAPSASTPDSAEAVARLLADQDDALLVAQDGDRVVGALIAAWDGWRGNMYRLAVLPEYRRRGIARRLVAVGHERLAARGATRTTALVDGDDPGAERLWRAAGYDLDAGRGRFVKNL